MKLLTGIAAAMALFVYAQPSQAGCGLTVTFKNETASDLTVLEVESKVTGGTYATVHTADFEVRAGQEVSKAIELKLGCAVGTRYLRVKYKQGANTAYETKGPLVTAIDRKINIRIK